MMNRHNGFTLIELM
ncbi:prepilin-type N-terminal cleavage/methylation domain-containing protein, partial [Escherichia coli]|nr:prepilin-type N-terminal cleavage/methylation domain-containing protein [Escherichia coli]